MDKGQVGNKEVFLQTLWRGRGWPPRFAEKSNTLLKRIFLEILLCRNAVVTDAGGAEWTVRKAAAAVAVGGRNRKRAGVLLPWEGVEEAGRGLGVPPLLLWGGEKN